ncbi:MAG TPA: glycosyltransferase [Lichenihabitans sp.]|jgi:hypothetical protein|nr:glycosyltransferase [Lichenihabitans sp.]
MSGWSADLPDRAGQPRAAAVVVAIPARDERDHVAGCLAALARQRDPAGRPLGDSGFEVILLANNCADGTAAAARALADALPYPLMVREVELPPSGAHAGGARKAVMDLAAGTLEARGRPDGLILTTDADSRVSSTWLNANLEAIAAGADAVAGYIDPDPDDYLALGPIFGRRGRLEDRYIRLVAEIDALCDPRPHDPWPNHRVASGASLGVTLEAYRSIGGLPLLPLGEDAAFIHALERGGFRVRHSMQASVTTSCRFDSRARGGAGDTMRIRHADSDAPCDDDIEPARRTLRRAILKGRLRRLHAADGLAEVPNWAGRLRLGEGEAERLATAHANHAFAVFWDALLAVSPTLTTQRPLRPSELPREIASAQRIVHALRCSALRANSPARPADRPAPAAETEPATGLTSPR